MVVWDSFSANRLDRIKDHLRQEHKITTGITPGGLSSVLQPLDVSINKPFKDNMKEKRSNWMMNGEKHITAGGNVKVAPIEERYTNGDSNNPQIISFPSRSAVYPMF